MHISNKKIKYNLIEINYQLISYFPIEDYNVYIIL